MLELSIINIKARIYLLINGPIIRSSLENPLNPYLATFGQGSHKLEKYLNILD